MKPDLQRQLMELIRLYQPADGRGDKKALTLDASLRNQVPLSDHDADYLMNDFFLRFKVDAEHYHHLSYFPEERGGICRQCLLRLGRRLGWLSKPKPLTIGDLLAAARNGQWPRDC